MARIVCRHCGGYLGLDGGSLGACPRCGAALRSLEPPAPGPVAGGGGHWGRPEFWVNALVCAVGVAVTAGTYLASAPGGSYVVAWGAIVFGGLRMLRGLRPPEPPVVPVVRGSLSYVELAVAPAPASPWKPAGVAAVALALAALGSGPKLYETCQVRGLMPGGVATRRTVTDKATYGPAGAPPVAYWVSWGGPLDGPGNSRARVAPDVYERLRVGDAVEVITTPGDPAGTLRDGDTAGPETLAFDAGVLALLLGTAAVAGWLAVRRWRRG